MGYDEFNNDLLPDPYREDDHENLSAEEPGDKKEAPFGSAVWDYLGKALNQIALGNYTDDVTALGTLG